MAITAQKIKSFMTDQSGATAIEYGLFAALLALPLAKSIHCTVKYYIAPHFDFTALTLSQAITG